MFLEGEAAERDGLGREVGQNTGFPLGEALVAFCSRGRLINRCALCVQNC